MNTFAFLVLITHRSQQKLAHRLVDSIRAFGGEFKDAPVYLLHSSPALSGYYPNHQPDVTEVILPDTEFIGGYLFADKVFACDLMERKLAGSYDILIWMTPESLLIQPPVELDLPEGITAALRPVHIRNVGQLLDSTVDPFWAGVYRAAGLKQIDSFPVQSLVDQQDLRAYFNSGMFAVRTDRRLMQTWHKAFEMLVSDADYQSHACSDELHQIFLHQAVFSAVLTGCLKPEEIRLLPPTYGYPLHLHTEMPPERRAASLNDLVSIIYEEVGEEQWKQIIQVNDPLALWLETT